MQFKDTPHLFASLKRRKMVNQTYGRRRGGCAKLLEKTRPRTCKTPRPLFSRTLKTSISARPLFAGSQRLLLGFIRGYINLLCCPANGAIAE